MLLTTASVSLLVHRLPGLAASSPSRTEGSPVLLCVSRVHHLPPLGQDDGSSPDVHSSGGSGRRRAPPPSLFVEALQVEALSINLSLSRPRESEEEVYVGLKLNRMLVDMMQRVDEARLKLQPFVIMHMITTPNQVRRLSIT